MLPFDVAVDADGDLFVSDSTGVQRFTPDGTYVTHVGEGEIKTALGGLAISGDGILYVTGFESRVLVYGPDGAQQADRRRGHVSRAIDQARRRGGGRKRRPLCGRRRQRPCREVCTRRPAPAHDRRSGSRARQFTSPRAVAVDGEGRVYVGQGDDFLIQRFDADGSYIDTFGSAHADENVWRIGGITIDSAGTSSSGRCCRITSSGLAPMTWPSPGTMDSSARPLAPSSARRWAWRRSTVCSTSRINRMAGCRHSV